MRKIFLFAIIALFGSLIKAQTPNFKWVKGVGMTGGGRSQTIAADFNGNVYTTGWFMDTVDFDPGTSTFTLSTPANKMNTFISKWDSSGNFIWTKQIEVLSGYYGNRGQSIVVNSNGIYVTGHFSGGADFDPGIGTYAVTTNTNINNSFVLNLDINGNFNWVRTIDDAVVTAFKCDSDNNLHLAGSFCGTVDFNLGSGTFTLTTGSVYDRDLFIAKFDSLGNFVWAKQFVGINNDNKISSIAIDNNNCVYATGKVQSPLDFDPDAGVYYLPANAVSEDVFVLKLDSSGNFNWAVRIGSYGDDEATDLSVDQLGNTYTTGHFVYSTDFDPGSGVYILDDGYWQTNAAAFILKLNAMGNFVWAKSLTGNNVFEAHGTSIIDNQSGIFAAGYYHGKMDANPGLGTDSIADALYWDSYMIKLDTNGNYIWSKQQHGVNNPLSQACNTDICVDMNGNIYSTGFFQKEVDFNFGQTPAILNSLSASSIFVCKNGETCTLPVDPINATSQTNQNTCANKTLTLSVISLGTPYWYSSPTSTIVIGTGENYQTSILAPGTYTYYAEANTCTVSPSRTAITITVNPTPTLSVASSSNVICEGISVILNVSGANTYTWSTGVTSNSVSAAPIATTIYSVTGTASNNCIGTETIQITVNQNPLISINSGTICEGQSFTITPSGANTYTYSCGSVVVSPSATTNYTVTGEDLNNCLGTATVQIAVNPNPTINVNSGTICEGQSFTITAIGANTYTYSGGSDVVNPSVSSNYIVTGEDINSCVGTATTQITVNPNPTVAVVSTNSVCIGTSASITANGADTYSWSTGSTTNSITETPTITTTYTVTGTDINSCINTQTVSITVDNTCQDVWPGDANSDGTTDNIDVLELGLHYAQTGMPRTTTSNTWQSYRADNWAGTISSGKNLNHSDCNGDGTINNDDTLAIYNNYGLTHAFKATETNTVNPQLSIVPDQNYVDKGNWGTASIYLGESTAPINTINGVAFTVDFDNTLIETNNIYIEYQNSFLDVANQNLDFRKADFANGKIYTATTHTVSNNVTGYGKIATLHYQIKSTLTSDAILNLSLTQANQSNASGTIIPLTSGSATLTAVGASVGLTELLNSTYVSINPNPTNGTIVITSATDIEKIEVTNLTGQVLVSEVAHDKTHQLNLETLANGVYFVKVYNSQKQVSIKKLVVQK